MNETRQLTVCMLLLFSLTLQAKGMESSAIEDRADGLDTGAVALKADGDDGDVGTAELAFEKGRPSLREMVSQSDVVFRGTVEDIRYRLSEPARPGQAKIPYTYVTYSVDEVMHGEINGSQATLRFIGGYDEETETFLESSVAPLFDLDDEDILFVSGNNERLTPLVGNRSGRLCVIGDQVYTENGRAITVEEGSRLKIGDRYDLDEVLSTTVTGPGVGMKLHRRGGPDTVDGPSKSVTAKAFTQQIRELGVKSRAGKIFVNADPTEKLLGPDMTPAPPPNP